MQAVRLDPPLTARVGAVERPADQCPYRRPFPAGFDDCPAFTPAEFTALDLQHRPLAPVLSCLHLVVGSGPRPGGHYPRCRIGDETARLDWVRRVGQSRAGHLTALREASRAAFRANQARLWEAKGRTLRDSTDVTAQRDLRVEIEAFRVSADAFYRAREEELAEAGIPVESLLELVRRLLQLFQETRSTAPLEEVPEDLLRDLPADFRLLIQPGGDQPEV